MSSWLERQGSSHQTQLIATAIISGITVIGVVFGVQAIRRQVAMDDLKASIPNVDEPHDIDTVRSCSLEEVPLRQAYFLTYPVKVPVFGTHSTRPQLNREDERAADLAQRAQQGDYDEGTKAAPRSAKTLLTSSGCRAHTGAIDPYRLFPHT